MFSFYTPWKHQKTFVFRGYKMGTLALNSLTYAVPGKWDKGTKQRNQAKLERTTLMANKIFAKTRVCAYKLLRNISFSETFAFILMDPCWLSGEKLMYSFYLEKYIRLWLYFSSRRTGARMKTQVEENHIVKWHYA